MDEYRLRAARRLVAANPKITYMAPAPDPLLAIPVIEIEVDADGGVRHMTVMRVPTQAQDTVRIALAAIERAAPFGDVTHCPKPWKFTEVFLFDDDRRFKPRSLD
jgi:protein TonB